MDICLYKATPTISCRLAFSIGMAATTGKSYERYSLTNPNILLIKSSICFLSVKKWPSLG
jgi:hypothetical protein